MSGSWRLKHQREVINTEKWHAVSHKTEMRIGPFPDPEELEKYKEVCGEEIIDRIFSYAEREQKWRITESKRALTLEFIKEILWTFISAAWVFFLWLLSYKIIQTWAKIEWVTTLIFVIIWVIYAFIHPDKKKNNNHKDREST